MKTKNLAIYQPKGAAGEYSKWACNLYNGCIHHCTYCYCKRGVFKHTLGVDTPVIKSQLGGDPEKAFNLFCQELTTYKDQIIADGGLFFSFSTDPMIREEIELTLRCIIFAMDNEVPVLILTKAVWWVKSVPVMSKLLKYRHLLKIGFSLTGRDDLEPDAPTNSSRQAAMLMLDKMQFYVFASMEPVIDFEKSLAIILTMADSCKEFRIGLKTPVSKKKYDWNQCDRFMRKVISLQIEYGFKLMWKRSILKYYDEQIPEDKQSLFEAV